MSVLAAARLWFALTRVLAPSHRFDGGDLLMRWREVHAWFAGSPVYGVIRTADYPPGAYPVFWLLIGWTDASVARWIWSATTVALLAVFGWLLARATPTSGRAGRLMVFLIPFLGYASYATIVNGQASIVVVTCVVAGVLLLVRSQTAWEDIVGSALILVSLIKPTVTVPIVWVAMLKPQRLRPFLLIVGGYIGLVLLAGAFQPAGLVDLVRGWLGQQERVTLGRFSFNLQELLSLAHVSQWFLPVVVLLTLSVGYWVYRNRTVDVWVLMGVTSIVAMFWVYHRPYDDVLLFVPMLALIRVGWSAAERGDRTIAILLAIAMALSSLERPQLASERPTWGLLFSNKPLAVHAIEEMRAALWLAALGFLVWSVHREISARRPLRARPLGGP
jgi:hypothetical protein